MISQLREPTRPLRVALARPLVALGVHPNWITLAAIPFSTAAAWVLSQGSGGWALILALAAAAMDFLDGEVARLQNRTTAFGNYLEALVDRWVDGILLVGFLPSYPLPAALAIILSSLVSYSKARLGLVMPTDNSDWPGWGDRSDRLILLLLAVWLGPASGWSHLLLWILVLVSLVGCVQRVQHARRQIEQAGL
ncbi:CDP-alcohol phosphatidyltransferase family protein [bacterium]|nr:CDP-alcohol phosphatidyltransferase family protein [bacterium]